MPSHRLSWRRAKRAFLLDAVAFHLCRGSIRIATVQACTGGWFWYARHDGLGVAFKNTAHAVQADLEEAKRDCLAYVRKQMKDSQKDLQ